MLSLESYLASDLEDISHIAWKNNATTQKSTEILIYVFSQQIGKEEPSPAGSRHTYHLTGTYATSHNV